MYVELASVFCIVIYETVMLAHAICICSYLYLLCGTCLQ